MPKRSFIDVILLATDPKRKRRKGPYTLDGAPRKPTVGGGRYQRPVLPIYKTRAPRKYS